MFDLDSASFNPLRLLVALGALGFQVWYLLNVGFTDVLTAPMRDASLFRGAVTLAVVQGAAHLLVAATAPTDIVRGLTMLSVLPLAPIVAVFAGISFVFPGGIIMLHELLDKGDPTFALGYAAAAAYLGAAWWASQIAEKRAGW